MLVMKRASIVNLESYSLLVIKLQQQPLIRVSSTKQGENYAYYGGR